MVDTSEFIYLNIASTWSALPRLLTLELWSLPQTITSKVHINLNIFSQFGIPVGSSVTDL